MLTIEFPMDKLPRMVDVVQYQVPYYIERKGEKPFNIDWIEEKGEVFCVIPCSDGIILLQWWGKHGDFRYEAK